MSTSSKRKKEQQNIGIKHDDHSHHVEIELKYEHFSIKAKK